MNKKTISHHIEQIAVNILFYLSIICVITIPLFAKPLFMWIKYPSELYIKAFPVILFLSGLCCVYILFSLKQMYKSLVCGNPFVEENVSHLRRMAVACALCSLIYTIKAFFMFTIATVIIALIFIVGCLFCLTLKDLFKTAVQYKSENELTI